MLSKGWNTINTVAKKKIKIMDRFVKMFNETTQLKLFRKEKNRHTNLVYTIFLFLNINNQKHYNLNR